jgi:hypothetical protein
VPPAGAGSGFVQSGLDVAHVFVLAGLDEHGGETVRRRPELEYPVLHAGHQSLGAEDAFLVRGDLLGSDPAKHPEACEVNAQPGQGLAVPVHHPAGGRAARLELDRQRTGRVAAQLLHEEAEVLVLVVESQLPIRPAGVDAPHGKLGPFQGFLTVTVWCQAEHHDPRERLVVRADYPTLERLWQLQRHVLHQRCLLLARLQEHEGVVVRLADAAVAVVPRVRGQVVLALPVVDGDEEGLEEVLAFLARHQGRHVCVRPGAGHANYAGARQHRQGVSAVRPGGRLGTRTPGAGQLGIDVGVGGEGVIVDPGLRNRLARRLVRDPAAHRQPLEQVDVAGQRAQAPGVLQ